VNIENPSIEIDSLESVLQVNVVVVALPTWNRSDLVTLNVSRVVVEDGATGELLGPPAPYDITFSPAIAVLDPNSSVVFNLSLIPWSSAPLIYADYSDVTFVLDVACQSYTPKNPSDQIILGAAILQVILGEGSWRGLLL